MRNRSEQERLADLGEALATFMLAQGPEGARRMQAEHTARPDGRCGVCSGGAQSANSRWPCVPAVAARNAVETFERHSVVMRRAAA